MNSTAGFLVTKEYRRFAEFCEACRRDRYIGLCYGHPGVGKTVSARHYTRWDLLEPLLATKAALNPPPEAFDYTALLYTPQVGATAGKIYRAIDGMRINHRWLLEDAKCARAGREPPMPNGTGTLPPDRLQLIVVDEADRLRTDGLECLRDIYDRSEAGLVLIGMPGIEKRLSRYPQLYSRVGFVHEYRALTVEEAQHVLAHQWEKLGLALEPSDFTDAEAMATVLRITGGNFRLIQRLFAQVERIMRINGLQTLTKEVVEAARESLIIGPD